MAELNRKRFNYSPFVHSIWVEYNGWRFKNPHLIRLKNGSEVIGIPNGGAWCTKESNWVEDADVTHIMSLPDEDPRLPSRSFCGGWRIARDIEFFGKKYPIWCGLKDGFVWEDELPEGKQILPTRMMAYQCKRDEVKKINLFVTQGMVVNYDESNPTLDKILPLTEVPGFWPDPKFEVLTNDELVRILNLAAVYVDKISKNSRATELVKYLREDIGLKPNMYLPLFNWALNRWNSDEEDFRRQLEGGLIDNETYQSRWKAYLDREKNLSERDREYIFNLIRGPEGDQSFVLDALKLSNFLKNPLVYSNPTTWC